MVDGFFRKLQEAVTGSGDESDQESDRQVRPASEDPYGDPAEQQGYGGEFGDVRPASEDPYDDPAVQQGYGGQFGDVRPASEDPYGDPADEEGSR